MVDYGIKPVDALKSATSLAGQVLHMNIGMVEPGAFTDLIAVEGNQVQEISTLRKVRFVMNAEIVYKPS
jgi:imidazolonepropionase-like amidohydrolase